MMNTAPSLMLLSGHRAGQYHRYHWTIAIRVGAFLAERGRLSGTLVAFLAQIPMLIPTFVPF